MKQFFILLIFSVALLSAGHRPDKRIYGKWTETWVKDPDIDADTLEISLSAGGSPMIECLSDKEYQYSNVRYRSETLTFTMTNAKDPDDIYTLSYTLKPNGTDQLTGSAINNKGETGEILLQRIIP